MNKLALPLRAEPEGYYHPTCQSYALVDAKGKAIAHGLSKENAEALAAMSKDAKRLDWLARNKTINWGLDVGGYWFKSDLRWQEERIREAIDKAAPATERQPPGDSNTRLNGL